MRNLLTLFAIALAVVVSSCSTFDDTEIWNKLYEHDETLTNHEKRILALEELCKQMNTNITALQTIVEALEKNDYVTNVSPITKDGNVIGYTISFAKSGTITIYNGADGKDGADGADGKDGYTPQIGVKQASDGYYYWTVDGEWLLDDDGNKIRTTGDDGKDGVGSGNGENGADGKDGITPRLKIEDDYWYVSYDDGITWTKLGRATGEDGKDGKDGVDGEDGNNLFDGVFVSISQDAEYVYIHLADGSVIILPKEEMKNIHFIDSIVKTICCVNWDSDFDGELSYEEAKAVTDIGQVFSSCDIFTFNEFTYFSSVTTIGGNAFAYCESLTSVTIPDSVTTIGYNAFYKCDSLTSVTIPDSVITIGNMAFYHCNSLTSITIPDSVTTIGGSAFSGCSLTSVTIPDNVTTIGINPFSDCSKLKEFKGKYTSDNGRCLIMDNTIIAYANKSGTEYTIPDSVTTIGDSAFRYCNSLTSVTIPDSVTTIGDYAFSWCNSLTSVTIGDSVTTIGDMAFYRCDSLTSVYCKATTPPTMGGSVFVLTPSEAIYVPTESVDAYKTAEGWCDYADDIVGYDF